MASPGNNSNPLQALYSAASEGYSTKPYLVMAGNVLNVTSRCPYARLQSRNQFRLLKLFPKSFRHPLNDIAGMDLRPGHLHGILIDADLSGGVCYECMSYTWGTAPQGRSLWLADYLVPISDNLNRALRCLQLKDEIRLVWVDFVYIYLDRSRTKHRRNLRFMASRVRQYSSVFSTA